ncbi:MAG: Uma2 family endonuclease, partial [Methylococcaceae bacterium]|nr:Uma2 family endonuclease [Methylococcaceae bacterium]
MNLKYQQDDRLTEQEYLEGELISDIKHELIEGYAYAMAGASANHNRISAVLTREFGNHLKDTTCEPFASDMKVKVWQDFFYPDVMVVCDKNDNEDHTDSPLLIVEVLSKSTRKKDQSLKKRAYQSLASLQEYVLIEQDFIEVEICHRENHWQSEHYFLGDEVHFKSIDLKIP